MIGLYGFKVQFAPMVESGQKIHTVRAIRKKSRHAIAGEPLHLYRGLRTKNCRLLRKVVCIGSWPVHLPVDPDYGPLIWSINHHALDALTMNEFSQNDGFDNVLHFSEWILQTHGSDFSGWLIAWAWKTYLPALTKKGAGVICSS